MSHADRLVGAWRLVEWSAFVDGDFAAHPMGDDAQGQILYTADGAMSAILHAADRPPFGTRTFDRADAHQRDAAARSYLSYGGTYAVHGDDVHHHVAHSLFPDWVGTVLVRAISWDGDDLVLTTPPQRTSRGQEVVLRVQWRRIAERG
jgi:hypothetical protein